MTVTPLAGGYWNVVARVRGDGFDWVAKVYADGDPHALFPILPHDEARALLTLAGTGIAPAFVDFLPHFDADDPAVLLYAWVDGAQWSGDVEQVAELFARQHRVAVDGFRAVPTSSAGILAQAEPLLARADPADADRLRAVQPTAVVPPARRRALLHTDAGPGNLISGAEGLRLIDWQCPAIGDPAEDLFTFLSPAFQILYGCEPLAAEERARFLAAYGDDAVALRLEALWPAFTYRMAAYCARRRVELADADPAGAARYARALDRSLEDLA